MQNATMGLVRRARFLVGFGFSWICLWAIFGSLIGAKLNQSLLVEDNVWLEGLQRQLFRSAHAHMNSLSFAIILMGLSVLQAAKFVSAKSIKLATNLALIGTVTFGAGLLFEAFFPPMRGAFSYAAVLTGLGGTSLIFSFGYWGVLFLRAAK